MKNSLIAASVIAALSFNATASDLEAYEPVDNSSSMSTSDKVAAGLFSAAAVGIALLSSSSSSNDGDNTPDYDSPDQPIAGAPVQPPVIDGGSGIDNPIAGIPSQPPVIDDGSGIDNPIAGIPSQPPVIDDGSGIDNPIGTDPGFGDGNVSDVADNITIEQMPLGGISISTENGTTFVDANTVDAWKEMMSMTQTDEERRAVVGGFLAVNGGDIFADGVREHAWGTFMAGYQDWAEDNKLRAVKLMGVEAGADGLVRDGYSLGAYLLTGEQMTTEEARKELNKHITENLPKPDSIDRTKLNNIKAKAQARFKS
ncbi:hypothetical protein [Agarivorans sp. Alg241-V36]|uniref:hypothetical protein n=1 Tax=Agarivorans sp. Alg241-V36 TaxID=2305992 RepID=UPI0013D27D6B|nr:hypothetical protein [Agarivorans sp. Alg241-V36]